MPPRALQGLRYISDRSAGIRRIRVKRGKREYFRYRTAGGSAVKDKATLARIRALAIPPAYEDVWICPYADGHLQATGRDARGRKQYRYHAKWRANKDEIKHARMYAFGRSLPRLRRILRADLAKPGLPHEKVLALVVSLMDLTSARVGNAEYASSNGSFGLSTLLDRHAKFSRNGTGTLRFPGKSGKLHDLHIHDRKLTSLVRKCQHLPGQRLFQYQDAEGRQHAVESGQINDYLHRHLGVDYSAKDFRTWHATLRACQLLLKKPLPQPCSDSGCRKVIAAVIEEVATELRNTAAVCRKSYINPAVLKAWQEHKGPFRAPQPGRGTAPLLSLLRTHS